MTPDRVSQAIAWIWTTLELAAQGAYSAATAPAATPTHATDAASRFSQAVAQAKSASHDVLTQFVAMLPQGGLGSKEEVAEELSEAMAQLDSLFAQAHSQVLRAIRAGRPTPVTSLINDRHGGMAKLVAQKALLTLTVRDSSGRQWKSAPRLAQTIARGFAVQAQVIVSVASLRAAGHTHAYVGADEYPLHEIAHMRTVLFNPNSKELPRVDLPA